MKKALFIGVGMMLVALLCYGAYLQLDKVERKLLADDNANLAYPADGIYARLTQYCGNPIELTCEHGRISLRMRISHSISEGVAKDATDFIRQEIERLTTRGVTPVGDYTFEFKGEWPMWKPYTLIERGGFGYIGVEFAQGELDHQTIIGYGLVAPPPKGEEYPYQRIRFRV